MAQQSGTCERVEVAACPWSSPFRQCVRWILSYVKSLWRRSQNIGKLLIDNGATVTLAPAARLHFSCLASTAMLTLQRCFWNIGPMLPKRSGGFSPLSAACGNGHANVARFVLQQKPCDSPGASWISGALPFTVIVKWRSC